MLHHALKFFLTVAACFLLTVVLFVVSGHTMGAMLTHAPTMGEFYMTFLHLLGTLAIVGCTVMLVALSGRNP